MRGMLLESTTDHARFVCDARLIEARPRACQALRSRRKQRASERSGRCRVSDTHVAPNVELRAAREGTLHALTPGLERTAKLDLGHRGLLHDVASAGAELHIIWASEHALTDRAQIDYFERGAESMGEHADRRSAAHEVLDHLRCDRGRECRNSFLSDTVIGCEHSDVHALEARLHLALPGGECDRERLELTQRPGGLGELTLAHTCGGRSFFIPWFQF